MQPCAGLPPGLAQVFPSNLSSFLILRLDRTCSKKLLHLSASQPSHGWIWEAIVLSLTSPPPSNVDFGCIPTSQRTRSSYECPASRHEKLALPLVDISAVNICPPIIDGPGFVRCESHLSEPRPLTLGGAASTMAASSSSLSYATSPLALRRRRIVSALRNRPWICLCLCPRVADASRTSDPKTRHRL